jgi:hypothetical protein
MDALMIAMKSVGIIGLWAVVFVAAACILCGSYIAIRMDYAVMRDEWELILEERDIADKGN